MRIAYLSADYGIPVLGGKGGSIHIQQLIGALVALGHEVELYCTRLGDGDPSCIPARIVEVTKPAPQLSGQEAVQGPVRERLAKERGWMERASALADRVVAEHARQPYDMIYERYGLWSRAGVDIARRTGLRCVLEVNAPLLQEAESYRELAARDEAAAIEADVLRHADAVVAVSRAVADYVVSRGAAASRVTVIPNGVDTELFNPDRPSASIPTWQGNPVIGFVGGLKPWHGLQELLAAFRSVAATHPDARLLIIGDGPMRGWIEGFLAGTGLADRVALPGWVAHETLPGLLNRMDIATAPYPRLDGFYFSPLKLFEYMAAGRAIIASGIGQIASIIRDGDNGLLAEPGNADVLAAKIRQLLDSAPLRARLAASARAEACRYTWLDNARMVVDLGVGMASRRTAGQVAVEATA